MLLFSYFVIFIIIFRPGAEVAGRWQQGADSGQGKAGRGDTGRQRGRQAGVLAPVYPAVLRRGRA